MRIEWFGAATLLVESEGTRIIIDPYLRLRTSKPVPLDEARSAQAILITHPHVIHFKDVDAFSEGVRTVYTPAGGLEIAKKNGLDVRPMRVVTAGETFDIGAFRVSAYRGHACPSGVLRASFSMRALVHPKETFKFLREMKRFSSAEDDVLVYEISDGRRRLVVLGAASLCEEEHYPSDADMLVFPLRGGKKAKAAMRKILSAFSPDTVLLSHFDDAVPPLTYPIKTEKLVKEAVMHGMDAIVPAIGVWYEI